MKIQTVLTTTAGHSAPAELFHNILKGNPTAFGFAVQDGTGATPELSIVREACTPTIEQIMEFQRNAHDFNAMVCFGQLGSKFNEDDILPLVLNDGDDKPFLALGLEGDFSKHVDLEAGHTDEYNLAAKVIIPTLLDVCNLAEGDLEKIISAINDDRFNKDFLSHVGHRGVLTILPIEGDPIWLGKNELGGIGEGWQVSNLHGFGEAKQEPAAKPKSRFSFGSAKAAAPATSPPPLPAVPDKEQQQKNSKASVPEVKANGENLPQPIKCPDWVHKNDDKATWYDMVAGVRPDRWKNRVPVIPTISLDKLPKDLGDLMLWKAEQFKAAKAVKPAANVTAIGPVPTATSAGAPKTGGEIAAQRQAEHHDLIGAKDMEKILDVVTNFLDASSNKIPSISEIIAVEEKLGPFSKDIAQSLHEMSSWPVSGLFALGKHDYRALVKYAIEFRNAWRKTQKLEDLVGDADKDKVVTTTTQLTPNTTKTESVAVPAAKKGFSFKKAG